MPAAKPGTKSRIFVEKKTRLNALQRLAVAGRWRMFHYGWHEINSLRKELRMSPVTAVDSPTAATFEK